jgi:hypothetical protein
MSELSSFDELEREIAKVKDEFYGESGGKNVFFKKQQKFDCAKQIVNKISMDALLMRSCYIVENTYCVHIDYPTLKLYSSPETFESTSKYIMSNFKKVTETYGKFEVFLNLDGLTISGAERYKGLIETFCMMCFNLNTGFSQVINRFVVYNSPNIIDAIKPIVMPFMEENVKTRLLVVHKKDSAEYNRMFSTIAIQLR